MEQMSLAITMMIAFLLAAGIFHGIALQHHFFEIEKRKKVACFDSKTLLVILISFIILSRLLPHFSYGIFLKFSRFLNPIVSDPTLKMLSFSISSLVTIFTILLIGYSQNPTGLKETIGFEKPQFFYFLKMGFYTFLLAITTLTFLGILLQIILYGIFSRNGSEQMIITYLRSHPDLLGVKILGFMNIVLFAPALEEIVFRGCIQRYLSFRIQRKYAIIIGSILFSIAHFHLDQGIGNIPLLPCIFVLSCYLGFIYEKTRSLISPIVLHMLFNLDGMIHIFYQIQST